MYHAACKVEFQPFTVVLTADVFQLFIKLLITILLFVVVKTIEDNSPSHPRFHMANTTNHACEWSSTAGTYAQYNIRKTTTNSSTIGNQKYHSPSSRGTHNQPWFIALQVRMDVLGPVYT